MSVRNHKVIVFTVVLLVAIVWVWSAIRRVSEPPSEFLVEETKCVTAVCISDETLGSNCFEFPPTISKISYDEFSMRMHVQLAKECEVR